MTRSLLAAFCLAAFIVPGAAVAQTTPARPVIAVPLPKDVSYARYIAQIRAHLATGGELVADRDWVDALPHLNFPREEIYGVIREELPLYKTPPFDDALIDLARTVKARSIKQFPHALERVGRALDRAEAALKERQPDWPRFEVRVAIAVLNSALDEYEDAVTNGRMARPIGYQTARGFLLQADRMIDSVAVELSFKNPEPLADIRDGLAQLKRGFASVDAPKQPVLAPSEVSAIIARVEAAGARLN